MRKAFSGPGALAAAKNWRADRTVARSEGEPLGLTRVTLREAGDEFIGKAKAGEILYRGRQPYKPSCLRTYEADLTRYVYPDLGSKRLSDIRRRDLTGLIERLGAQGLSGSRVRGILNPVRVIFRRAVRAELIAVNPTVDLELPEAAGRRERVATVEEALTLVGALPESDCCLWATAAFAGLRRGELRALRMSDVDLDAGVIRVSRGRDDIEGPIQTKSAKGTRTVPVPSLLRGYLASNLMRTGRRGDDLIFGRTPSEPFTPTNMRDRANATWTDAKLEPIGLHELRHTYVSLMAAAGFGFHEIGDYVGHSSTHMTDRYRHLLDGAEAEAARRFDEYLASQRRRGPVAGQSGGPQGGF